MKVMSEGDAALKAQASFDSLREEMKRVHECAKFVMQNELKVAQEEGFELKWQVVERDPVLIEKDKTIHARDPTINKKAFELQRLSVGKEKFTDELLSLKVDKLDIDVDLASARVKLKELEENRAKERRC